MLAFGELDPQTPFFSQLQGDANGVVLLDILIAPPGEHERVLASWQQHSELMKRQKGFLNVQLHKGTGQSNLILNIAVWETIEDLRNAIARPEFQDVAEVYPEGTMVYRHICQKVAVPNTCLA